MQDEFDLEADAAEPFPSDFLIDDLDADEEDDILGFLTGDLAADTDFLTDLFGL